MIAIEVIWLRRAAPSLRRSTRERGRWNPCCGVDDDGHGRHANCIYQPDRADGINRQFCPGYCFRRALCAAPPRRIDKRSSRAAAIADRQMHVALPDSAFERLRFDGAAALGGVARAKSPERQRPGSSCEHLNF